jgi:hypothetical protein
MNKGKKVEISDIAGMLKEVREVSDRGAAIVLTSWVERELEQWIVAILPRHDEKTVEKLQGRDGALNSFYGKIHLGYALGLYDETTRENLDTIRRIRNAFAHTPQAIDFETDEVRKEVKKLKAMDSPDPDLTAVSEHRRKFMIVCRMLVVGFRFEAERNSPVIDPGGAP